jgi:Right handed beta helix region
MRLILVALMVAAVAAVSVSAAETTTYHVDGGSGSCSDTGPGSEAQPWCSIPDAPPAGSEVVVHAMGASYGDVNPQSPNVTYRGEDAPDVSGLAGAVSPSMFAGRTMPEVGDVEIRASGVAWTGFRHTAAGTAPIAALDVRQADDVRIEGNEVDYGSVRVRDADRMVMRANYLHNGPTHADGIAELSCPCGVWIGAYNGIGSNDVRVEFNRIDDWRSDLLHVQNSGTGAKLLHNKGFRVYKEPESPGHIDAIQMVGSGDVTIVGNDFRDVEHGILVTDHTPEDRNGDGRALTVLNNIIEARKGRSFLGPPGPGSLVANNTFVRAETWDDDRDGDGERDGNDWAGECDVDWTESRDPGAHSQGAVFANNFCKGSPSLVDSRIIQSANIHIPRFEEFAFLADYELPADSPAVGAANAAYAPPLDGLSRSRVGPPDTGARERQGSNPPPPSDRDGDGVPDSHDACPDEPGSGPNGCDPPPLTDSDGDGFPDSSDLCPAEPGVTPDGCPEIVPPPPPPGDDELRWSAEADRSPHAGLEGASLSGQVCVFLDNDPAKTGPVRFHLDEPPDSSPWRTENGAPWDFFGGSSSACTLGSFATGRHTITAVWANGQDSSTFTVGSAPPPPPPDADGDGFPDGSDLCPGVVGQAPDGCPPPEPEPEPEPGVGVLRTSDSANRSSPAALQGAVVRGNEYVFLDSSTAGPVRFHLDEDPDSSPIQTETNPPWDFRGGSATAANPWNTATVPDGQHRVVAVTPQGNVQAMFTVDN